MTEPLRETLARAINGAPFSSASTRRKADAVLRVLATWEPSDEVCKVLAAYTVEKGNPEKLWLAKHVIEKILRAMAGDGKP